LNAERAAREHFNSSEVKRFKGMLDEVLEAICQGASGSGVGKMLGVGTRTVCEGRIARRNKLFRNCWSSSGIKNLALAESLESHKDGILAFYRLNVSATLNVTFLSTNHIENAMRNSRGMIGKVCRWNTKTDQLTQWMEAVLLRARESFRRVRGQKEVGALTTSFQPKKKESELA
jgi:hypothetical protein